MKHAGKIVAMALFPALLLGCAHNPKVRPPSTAQAPTTNDQAGITASSTFPQKVETPAPPPPQPTPPKETPPPPPPPQPKPAKQKRNHNSAGKPKPSAAKPAAPASAPAESTTPAAPAGASAGAQQATNVPPSGVSPIGQLSMGEGAAGSQKRHDATDSINTTEQGLNRIKRTLSTEEQEIANQLRTYLKQARQALDVDDIDGAATLATKAKLLLEELAKQ